jgi:hypothetical protein
LTLRAVARLLEKQERKVKDIDQLMDELDGMKERIEKLKEYL